MEMVALKNEILKKYRGVGLDFDNGKQDGTSNAHWSVWQPNLGFSSMMGFVHLHSNCLPSAHVQYGECDFHLDDKY